MVGGGKIAGHTGTSFKHRKAFERRKYDLKHRQRTANDSVVNQDEVSLKKSPIIQTSKYARTNHLEHILKMILVGITAFLLITVFVFAEKYGEMFDPYYYSKSGKYTVENQRWERQAVLERERRGVYKSYLRNGKAYLNTEQLDEAQYFFVEALQLYPKDAAANLLLTEVLVRRCVIERKSCDDAQAYLDSVSNLEGIDQSQLKYLQELYAHYERNN